MWFSPQLSAFHFAPSEIQGLLHTTDVHLALEDLYAPRAPRFVTYPYSQVPAGILIYETYRLIHTLVSAKVPPAQGHNALEHALLYDLCIEFLYQGSDGRDSRSNLDDLYLPTINAFRTRVELPPVDALSEQRVEQWKEGILVPLFFGHRAWKHPFQSAHRPCVWPVTEISRGYFHTAYSLPDEKRLQQARDAFQVIYDSGFSPPRFAQPIPDIPTIIRKNYSLHEL